MLTAKTCAAFDCAGIVLVHAGCMVDLHINGRHGQEVEARNALTLWHTSVAMS